MKKIKLLLGIIVIGACFFFIIRTTIINWDKLNLSELRFNFLFLFISFCFYMAHILLCAYIWRFTFSYMNEKMPPLNALKIISISGGAKYIPGRVWSIIGQVWLITKENIKKRNAVCCVILFNILIILCGIVLGGTIYPIFYTFIFVWFIILHPKILNNIINFVSRITKEEVNTKIKFNYYQLFVLFFLYIGCWFFLSTGVYFLMQSFYSGETKFLQILGIFPLAWVAGFISFITPAGLGVREGILSYLLSLYMPNSIATISSIITRLWLTICELILFLIFIKSLNQYIK